MGNNCDRLNITLIEKQEFQLHMQVDKTNSLKSCVRF